MITPSETIPWQTQVVTEEHTKAQEEGGIAKGNIGGLLFSDLKPPPGSISMLGNPEPPKQARSSQLSPI